MLGTPAVLLAVAIGSGSPSSRWTIGAGIGLLVVGSVSVVSERERLSETDHSSEWVTRQDLITVCAVVVGAVITFVLSASVGVGPVLASAVVGVGAGLAVPKVGAQVYCGSFVGMASPAVVPSLEYLVLAGMIAGGVFVATTEVFGGVGGKLGTIAMCGCVSMIALTGLEYGDGGVPAWEAVAWVVPVAVVGAVVTVLVSTRLGLGAVVGSGVVGVVAGISFPLVFSGSTGSMLAAVAFCASFVGMSSLARLDTVHVGLAGGVCGVVYLAVMPAFDGAGGKLGTIAFIACLAVIGMGKLSGRLRTYRGCG
nr:hypothetical protein [Natronolimnobius sp. AArcel1]